jgi:hypothetical protein
MPPSSFECSPYRAPNAWTVSPTPGEVMSRFSCKITHTLKSLHPKFEACSLCTLFQLQFGYTYINRRQVKGLV